LGADEGVLAFANFTATPSSPRFERESGNAAKVFRVGSDQCQIENERVGGNQQVVRANWRSGYLQFNAQRPGAASSVRIERDFFNHVQQGLHLPRFPPRVPRAGSPGKKFETANGQDPAIIGRECAKFFDDQSDIAQQINASVGIEKVLRANLIQSSGTGGRQP
jgi:hypothetical protein